MAAEVLLDLRDPEEIQRSRSPQFDSLSSMVQAAMMGQARPSPPPWEPATLSGSGGGTELPKLDFPFYPKKPFERFSWQSLKLQFIQRLGVTPRIRGCQEERSQPHTPAVTSATSRSPQLAVLLVQENPST